VTITFLIIKELPANGVPDTAWLKFHQEKWLKTPEKLRAEYEKLVKSLASLHVIEATLREKVLHLDAPSYDLRSQLSEMLPAYAGALLQALVRKI